MKRSGAETTLLCICGLALVATFVIGSRWPLAGDSVLMHYVVWLTRHGFAPYRQIAEMNLPFTYMSEQVAMTVFGAGDVGWRLYDAALVLVIVGCSWRMLRQPSDAAGLFAGTLFAAVHLQDGVHMAGQRDLLVTMLQAAGGFALLRALPQKTQAGKERSALVRAGLFGACSVAAACIKPPAILFTLAGFAWLWYLARGTRGSRLRPLGLLAATLACGAVPLLLCLVYLLHFGALGAFAYDLHGLIAYHASLERRPIAFLLGHIWSPALPLVVLAVLATLLQPRRRWVERDTLFALGAASGLISYLVQGKGFPYQRYPFLLWTLLLCTSRVWAVLQEGKTADVPAPGPQKSTVFRAAAFASVASWLTIACGLVLIGTFMFRSTRFSHADPYADLRRDLRAENAAALDGHIQCLDTAGPCIGALYKERLTESTGFLYDCYLLDDSNAVVQQQREFFVREWELRPPRLLVLTDSHCFTGPRTFDKFTSWPWMHHQLAAYDVVLERHPEQPLHLWSRPEQPYAYRILRRRQQ